MRAGTVVARTVPHIKLLHGSCTTARFERTHTLMVRMRNARYLVLPVLLLAATAAPLRAQEEGRRILPAVVGGVVGVTGGGYVALSVVVAQARAGNYLHDFQELYGWRSVPVIAGGAIGTALGFYSPERLERAVIWGLGGMAAGVALGFGVGQLVWPAPEGKWAGAAIGAGAGLVVGYLTGALTAGSGDDLGSSEALVVPVTIRLPLQ
jgi:hypothetical protein